MPAKNPDAVITTSESATLLRDETSLRYAILALQVEAGDRKDDPRFLIPNQTMQKRNLRAIDPHHEWSEIQRVVGMLADAIRNQ